MTIKLWSKCENYFLRKKFALLPIKIDNKWIWLKRYWAKTIVDSRYTNEYVPRFYTLQYMTDAECLMRVIRGEYKEIIRDTLEWKDGGAYLYKKFAYFPMKVGVSFIWLEYVWKREYDEITDDGYHVRRVHCGYVTEEECMYCVKIGDYKAVHL